MSKKLLVGKRLESISDKSPAAEINWLIEYAKGANDALEVIAGGVSSREQSHKYGGMDAKRIAIKFNTEAKDL